MPAELHPTYTRDELEHLDMHLFNRFFTYQVPSEKNNIVISRIDPTKHQKDHDLILRLRATLKSPGMDYTSQVMRVSVMEEETGKVVVEANSADHDERSIHLDAVELRSSKVYQIKYEFFEKNQGLGNFEDTAVSSGHMGASACSKPHVVAELVIASKNLIQERSRAHYGEKVDKTDDKSQLELVEKAAGEIADHCDFSVLMNADADLKHGENGLYCSRNHYKYDIKEADLNGMNVIFSKTFQVGGAEGQQATYLFDMNILFEFAVSAQMKAIVQRADFISDKYEPLKCIYDHMCVETELINKNELGLDVILTPGKYELIIFVQEDRTLHRWLTEDLGLSHVPFTFELQAVPIVQNEEHTMCDDKLYLHENFIQDRFIDGRHGVRFTFDDQVLLNLVQPFQLINIHPEEDMLIKMTSKVQNGVNMKIMVQHKQQAASDIISERIGNTEMVYGTLTKGEQYHIKLDYRSSIITLSSFFDCPNAHLEISMIKVEDSYKIYEAHSMKSEQWRKMESKATQGKLMEIADVFSRSSGREIVKYNNPATVLVHTMSKYSQKEPVSMVVTTQDFSVPDGEARQIALEIFYDPMFYTLELLVESRDAVEQADGRASRWSHKSKVDVTNYKGSKKVLAQLEPGDYTIMIVAKLPGSLNQLDIVQYIEFQLFMAAAASLPPQAQRPTSLNFFGLLGPTGENFGQLVHVLHGVHLGPEEEIDFELLMSGTGSEQPHMDIQALESDGNQGSLDLSLEEIPKPAEVDPDEKKPVAHTAAGTPVLHPHNTRYFDASEDGVQYESLSADDLKHNVKYRLILKNRDPSRTASVSTKLVITEKFDTSSHRYSATLPKNFDEITRAKPKVPGVKESSFIQGSKSVMEAFKVTSLTPFVPKSSKVYQAQFGTGEGSDDHFMPGLDFSIDQESAQLFAQVMEYSGREDLFITIYAEHGEYSEEVARSKLGKYSNALGPTTLTKGKYKLVVHPDQDSHLLTKSNYLIKFGLDVLLEQPNLGASGDFSVVVEEVELCSVPTLPDSFNGAGFLHPLSGNTLQSAGKYRLAELLEGNAVKFDLPEPSLVQFYLELPEGIKAEAQIVRVRGTYARDFDSDDLNKGDESFLRRDGGFDHRAIIQFREFLDPGSYMIKLQGREAIASGERIMPRCEGYQIDFKVSPITEDSKGYSLDETCMDSQYLPEHMAFDEVKQGKLTYSAASNLVDVAYLDLKAQGEGPFIFFFQIQYDPRISGILGVSLSEYDNERTTFTQSALWRTPQDGVSQVMTVVDSGTFAIGIQTLSNTKEMFITEGLGGQNREIFHNKMLHETCLGVKYSYLVTSAHKGGIKQIPGGPFGLLGLLFGGGMGKMIKQMSNDAKLLDELGETDFMESCPHDDLKSFPYSEVGFAMDLTLLVQEKPHDTLDLVVEVDSFVRISIYSGNTINQVRAFLYENSGSDTPISWTAGSASSSTLLVRLKPQERAYRLKLEYESLDQEDPCPTFDFRVEVKPVDLTVSENFKCHGRSPPDRDVNIETDDFVQYSHHAFPSDFVFQTTKGYRAEPLEYDIILKWPNADPQAQYYLDIETESDFLTGQMTFTLFYEDEQRALEVLGHSQPVTTGNGKHVVQRLKLLDKEGDLSHNSDRNFDRAVLRLQLPATALELLHTLKDDGHIGRGEICHNFQLWTRAERTDIDNGPAHTHAGEARLVRVRWEGYEVDEGLFDPRHRLTAALEFDRSMKGAHQLLKSSNWVSLAPLQKSENETDRVAPDSVVPPVKRLNPDDSSTILLDFSPGTLARGWCQQLKMSSQHGLGLLSPNFDEELLKDELTVCQTNCLCDWDGTSSCEESTGICHCREPYEGHDCSQCKVGHTKDPHTGECIRSSKCQEQGGDEDCNGHGTCTQEGGSAVCACDVGFTHDGLDQCAKCVDPLFSFPNCQKRQWVLSEPDVNCKDLDYHMPRTLFPHSSKAESEAEPIQGPDGAMDWAKRYKLEEDQSFRTSSTHNFMVPTTSVVRLFVDTEGSGAAVKYRLFNDLQDELLSSNDFGDDADQDGFVGAGSEITLVHAPSGVEAEDAPYTLQLEYKRVATSFGGDCPTIDIRVIVEPLMTAQGAIKCSESELEKAGRDRHMSYSFGRSSHSVSEDFVLRSDDTTLYSQDGAETGSFAILTYKLSVEQSENALSILATYPFARMAMQMSLIDESTGDIVQLERTSSLQGARPASHEHNDMATYIEIPALEAGNYELEIALQKSLFLPTKVFPTCLGFTFVLEYIVRDKHHSADDGMYEVLSVRPLAIEQLLPSDETVIEVNFDKEVILDDLVNGLADRYYICSLVNKHDSHEIIHPRSMRQVNGNTIRLDFDFAKASPAPYGNCYSLVCSTEHSKGHEVIRPMQEETSYCFETKDEFEHDTVAHCNPFAEPKLGPKGKCICAQPYTGDTCESCDKGFTPATDTHESGQAHTRCMVDHDHLTAAVCNSHGKPKETRITHVSEVTCVCDKGYGGRYCDFCTDPAYAYPDCQEDLSSKIYDTEGNHLFLQRRRYNTHGYSSSAAQYFSQDDLEPSIFNEECGWVDFPDDLDRIEFVREFTDGELHVSDLYVVNHRQDNLIKFKPRNTGVFRFLAQQPELDELVSAGYDGAFDLEVGLYDPAAEKFVASAMNRHLELPRGNRLKMEYAALSFEVKEEHLWKPLYIFFRALNFTEDFDGDHTEGCLALYLEIEFRSAAYDCKHDENRQSTEIQILKDHSQASVIAEAATDAKHSVHSITSARNTFFAYQDYYVPGNSHTEDDADWEVQVSLQQKFIESNTLDILVEILESDVEFHDIRQGEYSPNIPKHKSQDQGLETRTFDEAGWEQVEGNLGPTCAGVCLIGGEKAHNEMLRVLSLEPRTYFRVWLFQQTPPNQDAERHWCANYQLLVSSKQSREADEEALDQTLRCHHEELPRTLNTPRYLQGNEGAQKDFHYKQSFRVDHLWHNQAHQIKFTLTEPSLVRFNAPIHRHLEFELVLNQDHGPYHHKTLIRAKHEDHHSSVFAQLESGDYHLKLAFSADAGFLQLPCQTVQIEMAIMTLDHAKERMASVKESLSSQGPQERTLGELLVHSYRGPMSIYRPAAVGWRHIEAGVPPYLEQSELYVEIMREGFRITEDDDAGMIIDIENDFLLSGVNFAISNIATGQIVEDLRHESASRLIVGRLVPGPYELIVYGHTCITNMDPSDGHGIHSFDLVMHMSARLLRLTNRQSSDSRAGVSVKVENYSDGHGPHPDLVDGEPPNSAPVVLTHEELNCQKEHLPLPDTLDAKAISGTVDVSDSYYIPTMFQYSHEIKFTVTKDEDAIRVLLVKSNAKIVLLETKSMALVVQSKSVEDGDAQLLIAKQLRVGAQYTILLEFSEAEGALDGEAAEECNHFILALKTWNSRNICADAQHPDRDTITTVPDKEAKTYTLSLAPKSVKKELVISEAGLVDLQITLDNSGTFYRSELFLRSTSLDEVMGDSEEVMGESEELRAVRTEYENEEADHVDFSRKHSTTYYFSDLPSGTYVMKLRQRFKDKGCASSISVTVQTWHAGSSSISLAQGSPAGLNLYQSQAEEQERPRTATKLPINLRTYKFMGGEHGTVKETGSAAGYLLFSGPVQLDEQESQNRITFTVDKNDTLIRLYAEHVGVVFTLSDTSSDHSKTLAGGSGSGLYKKLDIGSYKVQVSHASSHSRKTAVTLPPRTQLTMLVATAEIHAWYNETWSKLVDGCDDGSNFPLALRQEKQNDVHQLYYNYPLIKVSPSHLRQQAVLQNYNFRINVTSRMYFEVGMHMLTSHVTVQLSALNERGYSIQGKQRGNLNILDVQVGPGDYSIALKQPMSSGNHFAQDCGIFSLQGLVEPINLMSASANSGDILQRGIGSQCEEAADGDILPPKIYGSKGLTRGGGELHVDSSGHFMKRFRNVLFKKTAESQAMPEYDRVELGVIEDSYLHLSFLHEEGDEIRVSVSDTWMMGQEVKPQNSYKLPYVDDDRVELNKLYKLQKGRHYSLMVYYVSSGEQDQGCSTYDLTMSISHAAEIVHSTRCPANSNQVESMITALPKQITDRDLNHDGQYSLEKMVKLSYPADFKSLTKVHAGHQILEVLEHEIEIKLSHNFDIQASVEFEYDEALFTIDFHEISPDEETGELTAWISSQQSPLLFKNNNDHFRTVKRALHADDVESDSRIERHMLIFTNRQPDILHLISPDSASPACLYANVRINLHAAGASGKNMYAAQNARSNVAPMLTSCRPDDSPTFLHGRPEHVSFDLIFNKRPYLKDGADFEQQDVESMQEAIKLRAATVSLTDGVRSTFRLSPVSIYQSNKEYRNDEWHLGVVFDLSEFEQSATEKLVYAQLHVLKEKIVDHNGQDFAIEKRLEARGLPIYVFEQNDEEQLLSEETDQVKTALEGSAEFQEASHQQSADVQTEVSELEQKIEEIAPPEKKEVKCLCAHGPCHEGQETCSGRCDSGWTGPHCDTPLVRNEEVGIVHTEQTKDYTKDGLYRPQAAGDELKTVHSSNKEQRRQEAEQMPRPPSKAKKIEDDSEGKHHSSSWGYPTQPRAEPLTLQDQGAPHAETQDKASHSFTVHALGGLAVIVGVCYYMGKNGVKIPIPGSGPPKYGRLQGRDRGADSDPDDEGDDPAARRRMLELSEFTPAKQTGPSQRKGRGKSGVSPAPSAQWASEEPSTVSEYPRATFTDPPGSAQYDDSAAQQLQKELELFAQDDDEEGALIQTDDQPQAQWNRGNDEDEMQELENYFDQR